MMLPTSASSPVSHKVFVPGRVCMLGEHSDWAGGYRDDEKEGSHIEPGICLAYCTDCGIHLQGEISLVEATKESKQQQQLVPVLLHYTFLVDDNNNNNNNNINQQKEQQGKEDENSKKTVVLNQDQTIPFTLAALDEKAKAGDFFAHVCGTAAEMIHRYGAELFPVPPEQAEKQKQVLVTIRCTSMTLPMKKGLSSSAAIAVGLARLFAVLSRKWAGPTSPLASSSGSNSSSPSSSSSMGSSPRMNSSGEEVFIRTSNPTTTSATEAEEGDGGMLDEEEGSPLTVESEMDIAYRGELRTGSKCGRLDQCCAFGPGSFIKLKFDGQKNPPKCTAVKVQVPFYFVVCDLNAGKDTKVILRDLNSAYPVAKDGIDEGVHAALGPHNHKLIAQAEEALKAGDAKKLGEAFVDAQKIFDSLIAPKCPQELTAPRLHAVLQDEDVKKFSFGGKGVGSQGDGSAQFVCSGSEMQDSLCKVLSEKLKCSPMKFTLMP